MPKRKKYPRLPNGYGNIRFLGKNRKNPYAVHPPAEDTDDRGNYLRPKALCYVDDWYVGFAVLNAFHAGTYHPGDELRFKEYRTIDEDALDAFCRRILTDFNSHAYVKNARKEKEKTFAEVYELFYDWKYGEHAKKKYSYQSKCSTQAAFKNCENLHDKVFRDLKIDDLQSCLDECELKKSSIKLIKSLFNQMYKYAGSYELCEKDYAQYVTLPDSEDDEHGVPFTDDELRTLWMHKDDPTVEFILIMCFSGYRIIAYRNIKVDMEKWYFQGGVKNSYSRERMVPIHTGIQSLVASRMKRDGVMLFETTNTFRKSMYKKLEELNIEKHTPHDCRHTFSTLCEKYNVKENDRKRMLGHSFGNDITNSVYGHRTLEELREEIEKIQICDYLVSSKSL